MMILNYPTKKALKAAIGTALDYAETSIFGPEYRASGTVVGSNRPHLTGFKREFYAEVTLKDNLIVGVK